MQALYLVTGGCGFIGSCFVLRARAAGIPVIDLDRLTYCGNPENLAPWIMIRAMYWCGAT